MNVGVDPPRSPRAFELQPILVEGELQGLDGVVELCRQADRVEAQPRERMVGLARENCVEVVDHLHAPGIQSGRTRRPRHHRDVGAVATSRQRRAEAGDAASDDKDPGHGRPTMRLVSATSRFSCCTRSSTVGNAMSGCKYRVNRSSSRCW